MHAWHTCLLADYSSSPTSLVIRFSVFQFGFLVGDIILGTEISGAPITGASQIPSNAIGAVGSLEMYEQSSDCNEPCYTHEGESSL